MGNQIKFTPRADKTITDDDAHEMRNHSTQGNQS